MPIWGKSPLALENNGCRGLKLRQRQGGAIAVLRLEGPRLGLMFVPFPRELLRITESGNRLILGCGRRSHVHFHLRPGRAWQDM
eukprot:5614998-Prorocentrum_lima.AAC.1